MPDIVKWQAAEGDVAAYNVRGVSVEVGRARHLLALEEEKFEVGVRQSAMDYDAHTYKQQTADQADPNLDYDNFASLIREREGGVHNDATLRARYAAADENQDGLIDRYEFILFSIRDALQRSAARVVDIFREWDQDGSGKLTKEEFKLALQRLGFGETNEAELTQLFNQFDTGDGTIDYLELNEKIRQVDLRAPPKTKLRRRIQSAQSLGVHIDRNAAASVREQMRAALAAGGTRVIDVFRALDTSGDGKLSKIEFRYAMHLFGLQGENAEIDDLFNLFDPDHSGEIDYSEMKRVLAVTGGKGIVPTAEGDAGGGAGGAAQPPARVRQKSLTLGRVLQNALDLSSESVQLTLRKALRKHWTRVRDLFESWDTDVSGEVSRDEFAAAMESMGLDAPTAVVDGLFTSFDLDLNGACT